jgi:hypothetical protein
MMIFQHTLDRVLSGEKTQTRRVVQKGEYILGGIVMTEDGRVKYRTGWDYAIQPGRGQRSVARLLVKSIRWEPVAAISEADVKAEGFASRADFLAAWESIHGSSDQSVWVIEFNLIRASVEV